jgi:hypothetical protein
VSIDLPLSEKPATSASLITNAHSEVRITFDKTIYEVVNYYVFDLKSSVGQIKKELAARCRSDQSQILRYMSITYSPEKRASELVWAYGYCIRTVLTSGSLSYWILSLEDRPTDRKGRELDGTDAVEDMGINVNMYLGWLDHLRLLGWSGNFNFEDDILQPETNKVFSTGP